MTIRFSRPCRVLAPLAAAMACSSFAQQSAPTLPAVVVTATRSAVPLTDVLADVSIVDRDAIERSGAVSVSDVLRRLPGITITQTGGPASISGVFVRGAESRFTAVFVDGVRIDSQSTGGASWETIPLTQVERIEVLRGPAAAIYGSDAVAGVVQIFTRQGEAGFFPSLRVGLGSDRQREVNAAVRGGAGSVEYALGVAQDRSDGLDARPNGNNPDRDGYRNRALSGRLGWKPQADHALELTFLDNDQKAGFDSSAAPVTDLAMRRLQTVGLSWSAQWRPDWRTRVAFSQGTDRYESTPWAYQTETRVRSYLLRNEWQAGAGLLTADLERREDALQNSSTLPGPHTDRHQNAVALGYGLRAGKHSLQANARRDDDSEFGDKSTSALAYGYALSPQWRAAASTGTAFRAPTLFQRFSIYGTGSLLPEASRNHELGLRWQAGPQRATLVTYRNAVENLITYLSGPGPCINGSGQYAGCYGNAGRARIAGTTLSGGTQVAGVNLEGSVDWMSPRSLDTGKLLPRRARQQATVHASTPVAGWRVGAEWQYVGARFDDAANMHRLAPYSLVHLSASRPIDRDWTVLARIDNVADKDYLLARGYATEGRRLYLGLTWAPQR